MNIKKRYWIWEDKYYETEFQLGKDINEFIKKGIVYKDIEEPNFYKGINGNPMSIVVSKNIIEYISYSKTFFPLFGNETIWDLEFNEFEKKTNNYLQPTTQDYKGDILYVVFRIGFIAIAALIRTASYS